jgi:uncharacterized membrane protein YedE/YeeE
MKPLSLWIVLACGALFGFGLSVSTMVRPEVVLDFLLFRDLGLLLVLGGAVVVALLFYQLAPRLLKKPVLEPAFGKHPAVLNARTLIGAAIFGAGWGLCGVCPGPAIAGLGVGNWPLLIALAGIFAGAYVQGRWFST